MPCYLILLLSYQEHSGVLSDKCSAYNVFVLRLQQLGISSLFDD